MGQLIHGGDLTSFCREHPDKIPVDFSANINPLKLPHTLKQAYSQAWMSCCEYPDPLCRDLKDAIGGFEQVSPHWILCGNGAADLIYRLVYALRPQKALVPAPTFAEYEQALAQVLSDVTQYQLQPEDSFAIDEGFIRAVPGHDIVFLCNPNNPTGQLCSPNFLKRLLKECENNNAYLVVDECFLEFLPLAMQHTMKSSLTEYDKLIVIKAFTKIFAMPGLRLGYLLCACDTLLQKIAKAGAPWSVSVPAQHCGAAAVGQLAYLAQSRTLILREREYLERGLRAQGFRVFHGWANYLLFYSSDFKLAVELRKKGFLIRNCSNFAGLGEGYFRIAVRLREENCALLKAMEELVSCSM